MIIAGRSDAVLNPGGVRIGTAEIYRQVEKLDEVLEAIAIGQEWDDDVRVVLFVVMQPGIDLDDQLRANIARVIRDNTTPRHVPRKYYRSKRFRGPSAAKLSSLRSARWYTMSQSGTRTHWQIRMPWSTFAIVRSCRRHEFEQLYRRNRLQRIGQARMD